MVGHTSLSGDQKKISVNLSTDRATLQVAAVGGRYVLNCGLPEKVALRVLSKQAAVLDEATGLVDYSFLPDDQKQGFKRLLADRTNAISAEAS